MFFHVLDVPGVELGAAVAGERGELEGEEFMDVERAGLVLLVELDIFRFLHFAVDDALADQELRPFEIGVAGKKGVVEVKESKVHGCGRTGSERWKAAVYPVDAIGRRFLPDRPVAPV